MNYRDMTNDELIEKLEKLNEDVRALLHDIGSPLSAIWGYNDLVILWLQKKGIDEEEIYEYLDEINGHMREIEQIIKSSSRSINGIKDDQIFLENDHESDMTSFDYDYEEAECLKPINSADMIIDRLNELLIKSNSIANIHINEEDIAGTEVEIGQSGSDYIKAIFPKQMDFHLFIPISSIYYIKVKPSSHSVDIYMR